MKRKAVRWVSKKWNPAEVGEDYCDNSGCHDRIEITYDDGLSEPEGKCPCANLAKTTVCCTFKPLTRSGDRSYCCTCHGGPLPCTNAYHAAKKEERVCRCTTHDCCRVSNPVPHCVCCAPGGSTSTLPCLSCGKQPAPPKPETRDRVVKGCVNPKDQRGGSFTPHFSTHGNCIPATLIIHEPVKEPTLVEAAEALVAKWDRRAYGQTPEARALRAALAREKGKNRCPYINCSRLEPHAHTTNGPQESR